MRRTVLAAVFALSISAVLSLGCDSGGPPAANSFTEVYTTTIQPRCSNDFCHFNGVSMRWSALDLSSKVRAYSSLVGLPTMALTCWEKGMRVVPGDPGMSFLYLKLLERDPKNPAKSCGIRMPADTAFRTNGISELTFPQCQNPGQPPTDCANAALPAEEQQRIFEWINEGAQNN